MKLKIFKVLKKQSQRLIYARNINDLIKEINHHNKKCILFFYLVDWQIPLFQRPQHIAKCLAKEGYTFIYFTGNVYDDIPCFDNKDDNLYIVNDVFSKKIFKKLKVDKKYIQLYSTDMKTTNKQIDGYLQKGYEILYEYIDEISPELYGDKIPQHALSKHKRLINDLQIKIVCTARKLYEEVRQIRGDKNLELITNGVQYEHFSQIPKEPNLEITEFIDVDKPVVGYFGALASWFDYELIEEIAKKRPEYQILLIGWKYDDSYDKSNLNSYKNIFTIGPIAYDRLPLYVKYFDVSIIPFKLNDITDSTSPIKLFEYMALNRPIITTDMPECRLYKSVLIGKDSNEFIEHIDECLRYTEDKPYFNILKEEALENTWEVKAKKISELLQA